jgi:hypothetical protein
MKYLLAITTVIAQQEFSITDFLPDYAIDDILNEEWKNMKDGDLP